MTPVGLDRDNLSVTKTAPILWYSFGSVIYRPDYSLTGVLKSSYYQTIKQWGAEMCFYHSHDLSSYQTNNLNILHKQQTNKFASKFADIFRKPNSVISELSSPGVRVVHHLSLIYRPLQLNRLKLISNMLSIVFHSASFQWLLFYLTRPSLQM